MLTDADGWIAGVGTPATHELCQTGLTGCQVDATVSLSVSATDTIEPMLTAAKWIARNVLNKRKALMCLRTPGALNAIGSAPRTIATPTTRRTHIDFNLCSQIMKWLYLKQD